VAALLLLLLLMMFGDGTSGVDHPRHFITFNLELLPKAVRIL